MIDIRRLPLTDLEAMRNAVAGLFRLEASRNLHRSREALDDLHDLLDPVEHAIIRRDITRWVCEVILPSRIPGVNVSKAKRLEEVSSMITENAWDWTAEWRTQGLEEGRREGRKIGRREGEAALLLKILERKFGTLDAVVEQRIAKADADQLLEWGERFVTARSLADVFGEKS